MLKSLITSQTRIRLLMKFFLNSSTRSWLRGLESEFGESTNGIRVELNRLERAGLLVSSFDGNRKMYRANTGHPLFEDIHNILIKETGIHEIIERVVSRAGDLRRIYLTGDMARGKDSQVLEFLIVGREIDMGYMERKAGQSEKITRRKIMYTLVDPDEEEKELGASGSGDMLILWASESREKKGTAPERRMMPEDEKNG